MSNEEGPQPRAVGVLGHGAIGSVVADRLAAGAVDGAVLAGVAVRSSRSAGAHRAGSLAGLLPECDLIVEAAGQAALARHGREVLDAGCDLLAVSIGALADPSVFDALTGPTPGRLHLCSGAIGGIDLVRAVAALGPVSEATITTTKKPGSLVQPTMSATEAADIASISEPTTLFEGDIRELVTRFPTSTNVAATLALAVGSWDTVRGRVRADPAATLTSHVIEVGAEAGRYRFEMSHRPSADNPRSSAIVPWAVLRSLQDLCGRGWSFR